MSPTTTVHSAPKGVDEERNDEGADVLATILTGDSHRELAPRSRPPSPATSSQRPKITEEALSAWVDKEQRLSVKIAPSLSVGQLDDRMPRLSQRNREDQAAPPAPPVVSPINFKENHFPGSSTSVTAFVESVLNETSLDSESQLAKTLLADEQRSVTLKEAFRATLLDMVSLQKALCTVEEEVRDWKHAYFEKNPEQPVPILTKRTEPADSGRLGQNKTKTETSPPPTEESDQDSVQQLKQQRAKLASNLKKKKTEMAELKKRLQIVEEEKTNLEEEVQSLRLGVQAVVAVRDDLRNKLRSKQDIFKMERQERVELEKQLKMSELQRSRQNDLLGQYRKLAMHTGYFKWGKQIRHLEADLVKFESGGKGGDDLAGK